MSRILVINGSPKMDKGKTGMILKPFVEGMRAAGAEVEVLYAKKLNVKPCLGEFSCWYRKPGECIIKDEMERVYDELQKAQVLIIATPVYAPLPGELQNVLNRLMPIIEPVIEIRENRRRARCHQDISIRKVMTVTTGGWWEKANADVVIHIVQEMARNCSIEFAGAIIRQHVDAMLVKGGLTEDGQAIMKHLHEAGSLLASSGSVPGELLDAISRPLVDVETYRAELNLDYESV